MTIVGGFVARDGILLCADSQYTGAEKAHRPKILSKLCGAFNVAFALSGDEDYAKTAIFDAFEAVKSIPSKCPIAEARKSIRRAIKPVITDYNQAQLDTSQRPSLLVAISKQSEQALFSSRDTAMPEIDSYACLGSGAYLGQYLIPPLLPYPPEFMTIRSLVPIALHMMAAAKRHDAYCGGGSHFMAIRAMESREFRINDVVASDIIFSQYTRLSGQLLFRLANTEPSRADFNAELLAFTERVTGLREAMLSPDSEYSRLLTHLSPLSQPGPESTTDDQSPPQPSQE